MLNKFLKGDYGYIIIRVPLLVKREKNMMVEEGEEENLAWTYYQKLKKLCNYN